MLISSACRDSRLRMELALTGPIAPGTSPGAKLVQEYLCVNNIKLTIDGIWGPATQAGLDQFFGGPVATVDQAAMDALAQPLLRAAAPIAPQATLGDSVVLFARQQLLEHPIEIGGDNRGPWVRFYMDGNDGVQWEWCAGFVTYIVIYCAGLHGVTSPVRRTFSCDTLGNDAQNAGRFNAKGTLAVIPPGSIFLLPRSTNDWQHTGLVLAQNGGALTTAEGNTNEDGSVNGWEAAQRFRAVANVDIITL